MILPYIICKGAKLASATSAMALVVFLPHPESRASFGAQIRPVT